MWLAGTSTCDIVIAISMIYYLRRVQTHDHHLIDEDRPGLCGDWTHLCHGRHFGPINLPFVSTQQLSCPTLHVLVQAILK